MSVADTIGAGAGDTLHGALIASLHRDDALTQDAVRNLDNTRWQQALKLAAAAAAITVSRVCPGFG